MKVAHRGVVASALPGLSGGWVGASPPAAVDPPPNPPASVGGGTQRETAGGGLDFWLLDRLFGRR